MPDCERAESKNKYAGQNNCGYGQLPDLVCSQLKQDSIILECVLVVMAGCLTDCERAESKNVNARQNYCGYGQLPYLICSQLEQNGNKSGVFIVMASYLTVSVPSRKNTRECT